MDIPKVLSPRGPLSDEVKRWIVEKASELTVEEIADQLGVRVGRVTDVLDAANTIIQDKNFKWRDRLRRSQVWKHIKEEFTTQELAYFTDKYVVLMEQFKEDVLPTEEQQVIGLIRVEIMQHRNMSSRMQLGNANARIQGMIDDLLRNVNGNMAALEEDDRDRIIELQNQQTTLENSQNLKTKEFLELGKEHSSLTEKLKASRAQRINSASTDKLTWPELIKQLMDRDIQDTESRKFELQRIAKEKELERLTKPHKFMDGKVDLPILYSESIDNLTNADDIIFEQMEEEKDVA